MMKIVLRKSAIWVFMLLYLVLVFGFVENRYEDQLCNSLLVSIEDSLHTNFISSDDVVDILRKNEIEYLGVPLHQLNLDAIEEAIYSNQIVEECKIYTGVNGTLHAEIRQRHPFVRVIEKNGRGYYLDNSGNVLNLSSRFTPHVLVVNGNIRSRFNIGEPANVNTLENNTANKRLKEIFELASFINDHPLWKAQIVQLYLNEGGDYELVPRIGPHIIVLGSIDDYEKKFEKLEYFYKEGLNKVGWNQYLTINLKYKDQVVCTKI